MHKFLLALHVLTAVFAIGPLVHAATTASRGIRGGNAEVTAASARTARIYGYASIVVVVLGLSLVRPKWHVEFSDVWVWLSLVLWAVATALVLALVVPTLDQATKLIKAGNSARALTGRVAAGGGVVGLIFAAIVFLMIYQPD